MPSRLPPDIKPSPQGPNGRVLSSWARKCGITTRRVLEWSTTAPEPFEDHVALIKQRVSTDDDTYRQEEARTLKIEGFLQDGPRTILVYDCSEKPTSLRDVLKHVQKPSVNDRRNLAYVIATQVRSLHVHSEMVHTALRADSFIFFLNPYQPNFTRPYVVDWTRTPSPIHQHPEYQADKPAWFYDAWSLLMILSEIAEWKPLEEERGDTDLLVRKLERRDLVTSAAWKGEATAAVFRHAFLFLSRDRAALERMSKWETKKFYDRLCAMFSGVG